MEFKLDNSFDANLALFRAEVEKIDPECAKILFDNLHLLDVGGDSASGRAGIGDLHKAVLISLDALPKAATGDEA